MNRLPVVFQNTQFIVVDKPAGLNFHCENEPGLVVLLKQQLKISQLFPVHRLDKMTSGLVVFALSAEVANQFRLLFESKAIAKYYVAVAQGKPKKKQGWVKGDMLPGRRGSWMLSNGLKNPAITHFISVSIRPSERLYLIRLYTGKTHQIRVALKSLGVPICGDERYQKMALAQQEDRGYLHAYAIQFTLNHQAYQFVLPPKNGVRFQTGACLSMLEQWQTPWMLL